MSAKSSILKVANKIRDFSSFRREFTAGKIIYTKKSQTSSPPPTSKTVTGDVPGLTVGKIPSEPVGPGAKKDGQYKNPEYYCYDKTSYFEAEIEMLQYRCPQPSNKVKYEHTK